MILLINPRLVVQKHDTFTTGIVYMPIGLAYFSDGLTKLGFEHEVLDLFGTYIKNPTSKSNLTLGSWVYSL